MPRPALSNFLRKSSWKLNYLTHLHQCQWLHSASAAAAQTNQNHDKKHDISSPNQYSTEKRVRSQTINTAKVATVIRFDLGAKFSQSFTSPAIAPSIFREKKRFGKWFCFSLQNETERYGVLWKWGASLSWNLFSGEISLINFYHFWLILFTMRFVNFVNLYCSFFLNFFLDFFFYFFLFFWLFCLNISLFLVIFFVKIFFIYYASAFLNRSVQFYYWWIIKTWHCFIISL